jgi:hypothetical protein
MVSGAVWEETHDVFFAQTLVALVGPDEGKRTDAGFQKEVWKQATGACNAKFGWDYNRDVYKARLKKIRGDYTAFLALKGQSGFGMEETDLPGGGKQYRVTAPEDTWTRLAMVCI